MNTKTCSILLIGFVLLLTACGSPAAQVTPTQLVFATPSLSFITTSTPSLLVTPGAMTPLPGQTVVAGPGTTSTTSICNDQQVTQLIDSFKKAILNSDGSLLSSMISPTRHMDVAFFRDGTVITYDPEHAKFLFESTFQVDWGAEPGSGKEKIGSFHEVVVPELVNVFNQQYTLKCNEIQHGGASYDISWPYQGEYYSVYFPGTQANGNMDWRTWVMGIEYVNSKPYIYALMQFFWEP